MFIVSLQLRFSTETKKIINRRNVVQIIIDRERG